LQVTRRGETRTQHELRFEVRDSGIGIAKENHHNLFRAFSQADASTTRLYGGTGLGLVICKRIVDLMGGTIGVESEAGRGSTFWFEIPLMKAAGDIQGQRTDLNGARILLLSTDAALRQRLLQAAPGWGAQLTEAETTQDALTRLRNSNSRGSNWSFDLLIVDLNSARATAIALHRNLTRSVELEDLHVVYLQGNDPAPSKWRGEYFGDVDDVNSELCHVRISNPRESGGVASTCSDSFLMREPKSLWRMASKNAFTSSSSPLTCNSTRPSGRLRTHPVMSNPVAICRTVQRKPTPWTCPS